MIQFAGKPQPFDLSKKKDNVKKSKKQENKIGKLTGGRRQPRSGGIPLIPGDVTGATISGQPVLIEAKTTEKGSHSVTMKRLKKITQEAAVLGKSPAYWITFEEMPAPYPNDWVLVPADLLDWEEK